MREETDFEFRANSKEPQSQGADPRWNWTYNAEDPNYASARQHPRNPYEMPPRRQLPFHDPNPDFEERPMRLPFDVARVVDALKSKWPIWFGIGLICGIIVFLWTFWETRSSVSIQLMKRETPHLFRASEDLNVYKPVMLSDPTLVGLVKSPEVMQRVASKAKPPVSVGKLSGSLVVTSERDNDVITLTLNGNDDPLRAVSILNLYAQEFIDFTKDLQSIQAKEVSTLLEDKLKIVENELASVKVDLDKVSPEAKAKNAAILTETYLSELTKLEIEYQKALLEKDTPRPIDEKLRKAKEDLATLLTTKREEHPTVMQARAVIEQLEKQAKETAPNSIGGKPARAQELEAVRSMLQQKVSHLTKPDADVARVYSKFEAMKLLRGNLMARKGESDLYATNALGYYRLFTPATLDRVNSARMWQRSVMLSLAAALFAIVATASFIAVREILDEKIKTTADLERVTGLPVLATLGNLQDMSAAEQNSWAFRTWTILRGKLRANHNQGFVCGFISARHGEGRSTWINHLIKTANDRGLRVLTVATQPTTEPPIHPHEASSHVHTPPPPSSKAENVTEPVRTPNGAIITPEPQDEKIVTTLSSNALVHPQQVSDELGEASPTSVVHIPLPGWVWNLERRQQWQTALEHWSKIQNLVLLVELPPACQPESILLAENLPQLIWLADSGKPTINETEMHLETLRHAGCNLVGAVLNHEPPSFWKRQYNRWFNSRTLGLALAGVLLIPGVANAQNNPTPAPVPLDERELTKEEREREIERIEREILGNKEKTAKPATPATKPANEQVQKAAPRDNSRGLKKEAAKPAPPQVAETPAQEEEPELPLAADAKSAEDSLEEVAGTQNAGRFSVVSPTQRAEWQKNLTLGPGDILTIGFFGQTNWTKPDIAVGPDGRLSYLEATDVVATGLTIDQLRQELDNRLGKFHRAARTIVVPTIFKSKKYYVLGKVNRKGVFVLDQPLTVLEAVARANGFQTGILDKNTIDLADFQRSFLVRKGERIPINFERLFYDGDLSQNIPIEPEDYLYFPSSALKEVYVLGEVRTPGVVPHTRESTVIAALSARGGFTDKAYKSKVLIIRGSINRPETYVIDVPAILDARAPDFRLEAKDIVYVAYRPWIKAEELLDTAATAFIQSAVAAWAGANIGPVITSPVLPTLN